MVGNCVARLHFKSIEVSDSMADQDFKYDSKNCVIKIGKNFIKSIPNQFFIKLPSFPWSSHKSLQTLQM